jgi:hypothetical protein
MGRRRRKEEILVDLTGMRGGRGDGERGWKGGGEEGEVLMREEEEGRRREEEGGRRKRTNPLFRSSQSSPRHHPRPHQPPTLY